MGGVSRPLGIPVVCTSCADTDLPWWQVGLLAVVACLIAYGLLAGLARLVGGGDDHRARPPAPPGPAGPPGTPVPAPYRTVAVNREQWYSLAVDERAGRYYLTIPVGNRMVGQEEAYEVDRGTFDRFYADPASAAGFAARCRNRELDHLLRSRPGPDRGSA